MRYIGPSTKGVTASASHRILLYQRNNSMAAPKAAMTSPQAMSMFRPRKAPCSDAAPSNPCRISSTPISENSQPIGLRISSCMELPWHLLPEHDIQYGDCGERDHAGHRRYQACSASITRGVDA